MSSPPSEVTEILRSANAGDISARERLVTLLYDELRRLAGAYMRRERANHTLQPTALVNEAWLRMVSEREWNAQNRAQFFGMAATLMRRVLVDHARAVDARKRGGDQVIVSLENAIAVAIDHPGRLLDVHSALERFKTVDPDRAHIAELRFFGGLSIDEIAELIGVAPRTVDRQWRAARAWLSRELA
jgi:RNA polymerase sigma-70 factor (ECF subfamily)